MVGVCIYIVLGVSAAAVLIACLRSGHFIRSLFSSALQGIISLLAVHVSGALTGVTIAVNAYTLCTVGLFGIPGTISLVLLDVILR